MQASKQAVLSRCVLTTRRFGLPEMPGLMMGASAVIVWPSGKGACGSRAT